MARVSENENLARQAEKNAEGESTSSFNAAQSDIGQFNRNQTTLNRGGEVAANPWLSAGYLANQNRLQSTALNQEENAGKADLQRANLRSGGLNGAVTAGATKDLALKKMRLADTLSAERSSSDFGKNVNYQQEQAGAPLMAARAEDPLFATSSGLVGSSNNDLLGYQNKKFNWNAVLMQAMSNAQKAGEAASAGGN